MTNVIKQISALAIAFTLLGTGTTLAKNVNPKSDNTLTASAASVYGPVNSIVVNDGDASFYSTTKSYYYTTPFPNSIIVYSSSMKPLYCCLSVRKLSISWHN